MERGLSCGGCGCTLLAPRIARAKGNGPIYANEEICPPCAWAEGVSYLLLEGQQLEVTLYYKPYELADPRQIHRYLDREIPTFDDMWDEAWRWAVCTPEYEKMGDEYTAWVFQTMNERLNAERTEIEELPKHHPTPKRWSWQDGRSHLAR